MTRSPQAPQVLTLLTEDWARSALQADVASALLERPHVLSPRWLYDAVGSALFEAITHLEAYYPFRAEQTLLAESAQEICALARPEAIVELGAGASQKTRVLLDAADTCERFTALDVSASALAGSLPRLAGRYASLEIRGIVGDFTSHLDATSAPGRRMVVFLGSTVGNFYPEERRAFFEKVSAALKPGESLLLGVDLIKEEDRLVAAYDDPQGVTAAFNKNVLAVLNREVGTDFDVSRWAHRAVWNAQQSRVELSLVPDTSQRVRVPQLGIDVELAKGEALRTEISTKFRIPALSEELAAAKLPVRWTQTDGDVALIWAQRS